MVGEYVHTGQLGTKFGPEGFVCLFFNYQKLVSLHLSKLESMCATVEETCQLGESSGSREREKQGQEVSVISAPTVNGKSLCSKVLIVCVGCFAAKQNRNKPNVCDT